MGLLKIFYFPPNGQTNLEVSAIDNSEKFKVKEKFQVKKRLISLHFYDTTERLIFYVVGKKIRICY